MNCGPGRRILPDVARIGFPARGDGPVEYGEHVLLAVVSPHCPAGMDVVDLLNPQVTVDIPRQWPQRVVQVGVRALV